jgi:ATP-dependent Lhr-like helicase
MLCAPVPHGETAGEAASRHEAQVESACMVLLHRYGVVFRDLMERETSMPRWRDLVAMYRRLESRGTVRGGRFVSGLGGEQFALPEALESLRQQRHKDLSAQAPLTCAAADPMNLIGVVIPGERPACIPGKTVTYPFLATEAGEPAEAASPIPIGLFAHREAEAQGEAHA